MATINLCIAVSLDGYIADRDGKVDFLYQTPRTEPDPDYEVFYNDVEMILLGAETYRQLAEDISPGQWMYPGKRCYVFSRGADRSNADVIFTNQSPRAFVREVCDRTEGLVWLYGGHKLIRAFMEEDLIDQYRLYRMPVILGGGVPLFAEGGRFPLVLTSTSRMGDIAKCFYTRVR